MTRIKRPSKAFPWVVLRTNVIEFPSSRDDHDPESAFEESDD
jgi:hypothetical protein